MIRTLATALATTTCIVALATPAAAQTRDYNIPAGSLKQALDSYVKQSGRQVVYRADEVRSARSPGARGPLSADAALDALLAGSGFTTRADGKLVAIVKVGNGESANLASADEEEVDQKGVSEILVVGSRSQNVDIRRSEDDPQPYVVFTAEDLKRSSASNVEDFLMSQLPANTAQTTLSRRADPSSVAISAGQINLRGLGSNQTLVLVDGRRVPGVALFGGETGQPNISGIPPSQIERIEILPSTAGGIFGGGATGGVINVILNHAYSGIDVNAEYGDVFDGHAKTVRFGVAGGLTLGKDKQTQISFSADHYDADPMLLSERPFFQKSVDLTAQNNPALFSLVPFFADTPNICAAIVYAPRQGFCSGENLVLDDGTPLNASNTFVPSGYGGPSTDGGAALVANAGLTNFTRADFGEQLIRTSTRNSAAVDIRHEFGDWLTVYSSLSGARVRDNLSYSGFSQSTALLAGDPANPFQQDIVITQPIYGVPQRATSETTNYHALGGVIIELPLRWRASLEHSWSKSSTKTVNSDKRLSSAGLDFATQFALQDSLTSPIDLSPFFLDPIQPTTLANSLEDTSLRLSGPLGRTWAGEIVWTGLIERRVEKLAGRVFTLNNRDPSIPNDIVSYQFAAPRSQKVTSFYLEGTVPLISAEGGSFLGKSLDLQASIRRDTYHTRSTGDQPTADSPDGPFAPVTYFTNEVSSTDYTVALKYEPIDGLILRASWGSGFLPPSLSQLSYSDSELPAFIFNIPGLGYSVPGDPKRGGDALTGDANGAIVVRSLGSPELKPETSQSWSAGFVVQPRFAPGLRLSADYTRIIKNGEIQIFLPPALILSDEDSFPGRVTRGPNLPGDPPGYAGPIVGIDTSAFNIGRSRVSALDIKADYEFDTSFGKVALFAAGTKAITFRRQLLPDSPFVDSVGLADGPLRWRANFGANWSNGPLSVGWNAQFYDSYSVSVSTDDDFLHEQRELAQGGRVRSQIYHDLSARYRLLDSSNGGPSVELTVVVSNVFNESPPVIAYGAGDASYSTYGDPRLRRFTAGVRAHF